MPRPCALAILAAPYLAGLWRLFQGRPGLALEGALWLAELALDSAGGRRPQAPGREADKGADVCYPWECEPCTPCPAPERCEEEVCRPCECELCTPCPAPERCEEDAGPPEEQECEPVQVNITEPVREASTPASWWQLGLGAAVTFVSGLLTSCGCRSEPWEYGHRRAHYALARAHVRGVLRG